MTVLNDDAIALLARWDEQGDDEFEADLAHGRGWRAEVEPSPYPLADIAFGPNGVAQWFEAEYAREAQRTHLGVRAANRGLESRYDARMRANERQLRSDSRGVEDRVRAAHTPREMWPEPTGEPLRVVASPIADRWYARTDEWSFLGRHLVDVYEALKRDNPAPARRYRVEIYDDADAVQGFAVLVL